MTGAVVVVVVDDVVVLDARCTGAVVLVVVALVLTGAVVVVVLAGVAGCVGSELLVSDDAAVAGNVTRLEAPRASAPTSGATTRRTRTPARVVRKVVLLQSAPGLQ
jgi:hypothetical protein